MSASAADNPLVCAHHFNLRDALSNFLVLIHFSIGFSGRYSWNIHRFCPISSRFHKNKTISKDFLLLKI